MSEIEGLERLDALLSAYDQAVADALAEDIEKQVYLTQRDLVDTIAMRTGRAVTALADPAAVRIRRTKGQTVGEVGLLTLPLRRAAFYLFFLEKGRKSYLAGQYRFAGIDKRYAQVAADKVRNPNRDNRKWRKIKRTTGAIEPRLYFRFAFTRLRERMNVARAVARGRAALRTMSRT